MFLNPESEYWLFKVIPVGIEKAGMGEKIRYDSVFWATPA
jgi:hypothetical protein